jgi:hypothetical protein
MKKLKMFVASVLLLWGGYSARGFVMIGPMLADELDSANPAVGYNITDDLGGPKELKTFFRWNTPYLTYSFDLSFVQYFGIEGMDAVHEAFRVVNDFFIPEDQSYAGVSAMDFTRDGFRNNFNTAWVNTTAQNQQVIDIKSLVLGMTINQLGVGNPHRYAFTIRNISVNTTGSQWNFNVRLKNYDPLTWAPTDVINGVTYSYRLIHDAVPGAAVPLPPLPTPTFADMEEFTTDTSGNAWTAVAGIVDSFYGNTAIYWTDPPTLFNFGVYYDAMNAMGGQYQPRHALTYDDAGALKYLYRTNNLVWEDLDASIDLVVPAQFLSPPIAQNYLNQYNNFTQPLTGPYAPTARLPRTFPRRQSAAIPPVSPAFPTTSPWYGMRIIAPIGSIPLPNTVMGMIGPALRGGIDKMQFYHVPFDSLMGRTFRATNYTWTDTIVNTNGWNIVGLNNTTPGASVYRAGPGSLQYYTQVLGRTVTAPDILFIADELGTSIDGVPIAWRRSDINGSQLYTDNVVLNQGYAGSSLATTYVGPGVIDPPDGNATGEMIVWTFAKMSEGFELIWSGEASVVGNQETYSLWGHIKGPGANDVVIFPNANMIWRLENEISPKVVAPTITDILDQNMAPIAPNSYTRTEENIYIRGYGLASGTAIEIMSGDKVLQTLFPVQKFIVNDTLLSIPKGILTEETEGTARSMRVWNTVGASERSVRTFSIFTGRAVVTGTMRDKSLYDRGESLRIFGYGFKSTKGRAADGNATLTDLRVEDNQGQVVWPTDLISSVAVPWQVVSDTEAILPMGTLGAGADGFWRRIRASRGGTSTLSPADNEYISLVSGSPTVTAFTTFDLDGTETDINSTVAFRRDRGAEIRGTGLNAVSEIRISRLDGTGNSFISFNPYNDNPNSPRYEPYPGVIIEDNGTRIQISKDVFKGFENDWQNDGHTADERCILTLGHLIKNYQSSNDDVTFNVNVQPEINGIGGFTVANTFNRSPLEYLGDDVLIVGAGLLAVSEIRMVDENGSALVNIPNIILSGAGKTPGVTQTDTSIKIDTSVMQFNNPADTDSNSSDYYRRFRLVSVRDARFTSQAARFIVGVPPTYTSFTGIANAGVDLRRDLDGTTFNGTALQLLTKVEIVDINGNPIAAGTGVIPPIQDVYPNQSPDLSTRTSTGFTIDANATTWLTYGHYMDTSTILSDGNGTRRIRVTTPFGIATSTMADGFTVSATPDYLPAGSNTSLATFAGTTDGNAGNNVMDYNASDTTTNVNGELIINGSNFRGIQTITLINADGTTEEGTISVNPNSPPDGVTVNAAGTQITLTKAAIENANATWLTTAFVSKAINIASAGDVNATSPFLNVVK